MSDELDTRAIKARLAERRKPHIGTCSACGHEHEMPSTWLPMASGMAADIWRCQQCGGQILITVMTSTTGPSVDDDLHDLLTEIKRLRAALRSRGAQEEPERHSTREIVIDFTGVTSILPLGHRKFGRNPSWVKAVDYDALAALRGVGVEAGAHGGTPRAKDDDQCGAPENPAGFSYECTLPKGHDGPHVAHGANWKELHRWAQPVPLGTPQEKELADIIADWKSEIAEFATKDDPYYNGVRQCLQDIEAITVGTLHQEREGPMTEYGLWDEERERWVRRGYQTAAEAAAARREIERRMSEDDDTNLQIVPFPSSPAEKEV